MSRGLQHKSKGMRCGLKIGRHLHVGNNKARACFLKQMRRAIYGKSISDL